MRWSGVSYEEIARQGGGILATVRATRAMGESELLAASLPRLQALAAEGVTTVEIKSGYGLTLADELKMLRVARRLAEHVPVNISTTLLAAHALPPEFAGRADEYMTHVCDEIIPAAAAERLADAVDVFCERIAFSPAQCERVFAAAGQHGLPVKGHFEQLSNLGGARLAARFKALSADHLEHLDAAGVQVLAEAGTVAVLLPGAYYFLRQTQKPPVAALRAAGVPMAVASDLNPGTCPLASLRLATQHGLHAVRTYARGGAGRRHPPCRPGARTGRSRGHVGRGQAGRFPRVGHRPSGRVSLRVRRSPAAAAGVPGRNRRLLSAGWRGVAAET